MDATESLRVHGLRLAALGAAVAGLGTFALSGYTWWSARGGVPTPDVSAVVVLLIPIGLAAGLISGRALGAPASWGAAVLGSFLAFGFTNAIDPGLPAQHSSFTGHELLNAAFLFPFIGGGHLLGTWTLNANCRSRLGVAVAGSGTCALYLFAWWSYQFYRPGGTPGALFWVAFAAWIGTGVAAGLISRSIGDAPASWAVAVTGFMMAYLAVNGIEQGSAGPVEELLYVPIMLVVFVAGGHVAGAAIGAVVGAVARRSPRRAAV